MKCWRNALALTLVSVSLFVSGCAKKMAAPPPPPESIVGNDFLQESLFKGDQAVLSNQDIDRILTARITLADRHRLAVLCLNSRSRWYEDVADIETQNSEQFLKALRSASQLTQVRLMPTLLIPERRTVPYLREAAARFQADLLLVYAAGYQTFQRDRMLSADEVKAQSKIESVLLDVRTGIVVDSVETSEIVTAKKAPGDLNFSQTIAKAQAEAAGKALLKLADAVVGFVQAAER